MCNLKKCRVILSRNLMMIITMPRNYSELGQRLSVRLRTDLAATSAITCVTKDASNEKLMKRKVLSVKKSSPKNIVKSDSRVHVSQT